MIIMEKIMTLHPILRWLIAIGTFLFAITIVSSISQSIALWLQSMDYIVYTIGSFGVLATTGFVCSISVKICPHPLIWGSIIIILSILSFIGVILKIGFIWNDPLLVTIFFQINIVLIQVLQRNENH